MQNLQDLSHVLYFGKAKNSHPHFHCRYGGSLVGLGDLSWQDTSERIAPRTARHTLEAIQNDAQESTFGTENGVANDESLREDRVQFEDLEQGTQRRISISQDTIRSTEDNPENLYVKTVWSAFRTDVMKVISGLGSRIMKPPETDVMYMRPIGVPSDTPLHRRLPKRGSPHRKIPKPSTPISIFGHSKPGYETRVRRMEGPELSSESLRQTRTRWLQRPRHRSRKQVVLLDFVSEGRHHFASEKVSARLFFCCWYSCC